MPQAPFNDTDMASPVDLFKYANDVTGDGTMYYGAVVVLVIWAVAFAALYGRDPRGLKALIASTFITFIVTVLLDVIGLVTNVMVVLTLTILAIAIVADKLAEEHN